MAPTESGRPIADYGLLSDCHSAGLVSRDGAIDWLCMPRFDSPSIFSRLLGEEAGHWTIRPQSDHHTERRYLDGTLIHETTFHTDTGTVRLTDALAMGPTKDSHALGSAAPHVLVRHVRGLEGSVPMRVHFAPRPEYGFVHPILEPRDNHMVVRGGGVMMALSAPQPLPITESDARVTLDVRRGDSLFFGLQHGTDLRPELPPYAQHELQQLLGQTLDAWENWTRAHATYDGIWAKEVTRSARVLQGLFYYPTGAMVAAPTTSLPEQVGGVRNWDYRYAWIRDTGYTLDAIGVAACIEEADRFFDFLVLAAHSRMRRDGILQIMFGVGGEHHLDERTLDHLPGWRDSRPVRIGNAAWRQRQLDAYGELLDAALRLRDHLGRLTQDTRDFLIRVADTAARQWTEKDEGIWELRCERRHFVYSKLMCWVALDRAVQLADYLQAEHRVDEWKVQRDRVRDAILQNGWSKKLNSFTQAFDNDDLDASSLVIPIVGFLPPDDARVQGTIRAVETHLTDEHGFVYRYRNADGLPGHENPFLLCTFWLAEAQARSGRMEDAQRTFRRAAGAANDLGLFAEEYDPQTKEPMGNFPQALSHIGLIHAALAINALSQDPVPAQHA